jgi:hypothetical protein
MNLLFLRTELVCLSAVTLRQLVARSLLSSYRSSPTLASFLSSFHLF